MDRISKQSVEMYSNLMGKLSSNKLRSAVLTLLGMLLGGILSKFRTRGDSKLTDDETQALRDKSKLQDKEIGNQNDKIASQKTTIRNQKAELNGLPNNDAIQELMSERDRNSRLTTQNTLHKSNTGETQRNIDRAKQDIASSRKKLEVAEEELKAKREYMYKRVETNEATRKDLYQELEIRTSMQKSPQEILDENDQKIKEKDAAIELIRWKIKKASPDETSGENTVKMLEARLIGLEKYTSEADAEIESLTERLKELQAQPKTYKEKTDQ